MDHLSDSERQRLDELTREANECSTLLGSRKSEIEQRINVPKRLRDAIRKDGPTWIVGGLAAGMVLSSVTKGFFRITSIFRPNKHKKSKSGLFGGKKSSLLGGPIAAPIRALLAALFAALLKAALASATPALKNFLTKYVSDYVENRFGDGTPDHDSSQDLHGNPDTPKNLPAPQ